MILSEKKLEIIFFLKTWQIFIVLKYIWTNSTMKTLLKLYYNKNTLEMILL